MEGLRYQANMFRLYSVSSGKILKVSEEANNILTMLLKKYLAAACKTDWRGRDQQAKSRQHDLPIK